ncbi:MAG TPA: porphobilinogen synthase [Planctomycetota bacterium]|nr:porphobilinogen synthase [Planctomycetota bacterium]
MASKAKAFLRRRPRRTRATAGLRGLVRETRLSREDLIVPLFVREGREERRPISSMPGQFQLSVRRLAVEARDIASRGLPAVLLFGIPGSKDARGSGAWARDGIIPQAVKAVKDAAPGLVVLTDVCLCEYTSHGHCGLVKRSRNEWRIENDATLPLLSKTAAAHVGAGADIVAPSGMMDGAVGAIRAALPQAPILSYAAKYASAFYGPFREAAESPPRFGDRSTYQMDPANGDEAMREIAQDLEEGADAIMVKPALAYLDIVRRARERFAVPLAAYNVSGEYSMLHAAGERGWIDARKAMLEVLTGIRRAGADLIVTYHAREVADSLG